LSYLILKNEQKTPEKFAESSYKHNYAYIRYKEIILAGLEFKDNNRKLLGYSLNESMRNYAVYTQLNLSAQKIRNQKRKPVNLRILPIATQALVR
jgi:hypothetical protein